jgi:hypothetical protein
MHLVARVFETSGLDFVSNRFTTISSWFLPCCPLFIFIYWFDPSVIISTTIRAKMTRGNVAFYIRGNWFI